MEFILDLHNPTGHFVYVNDFIKEFSQNNTWHAVDFKESVRHCTDHVQSARSGAEEGEDDVFFSLWCTPSFVFLLH